MASSPSEDVLKVALQILRKENPSLGISKIHALLVSAHPEWTVGEKRVRKILQAGGLMVGPPKPHQTNERDTQENLGKIYPSSRIIENLDVSYWSSKIQVKDFGRNKGKGLVALEEIKRDEVIWREDPWIIAPEWFIFVLYIMSSPV